MRPLILKGHTRPLTCLKYNLEGDLLFSAAKDAAPTVWYTETGERLGTFTNQGHVGTVWSIDVDQSSEFAITAGADNYVKIWIVHSGECAKTYMSSGAVRVVQFNEGCNEFFAVSDPFRDRPCTLRIYDFSRDPNKNSCIALAKKDAKAVDPKRYENENSEAPISDEPPKYSWTIEGMPHSEKVSVAAWGPLNQYIVTGDTKGVIRLHNPSNGAVLKTLQAHNGRINSLSFNKYKTLMITGGADCVALLWDTETWEEIKTYTSNTPVNAAEISPIKEHVLVAGGQEAMEVTTTTARVGKFETKFFHLVFQEEWGSVKGHFGPVNALAIHPDGIGFSSGSEDGYIRLHLFDKDYFTMHSEFDDLTALEELSKGK